LHTLCAIPRNLFPHEDNYTRPGIVIAHTALEFYYQDILSLVEKGVNDEINILMESHDANDRILAKNRKKDLKKWLSFAEPLSYVNFLSLCRLVNPSATTLPKAAVEKLVLRDFLLSLYKGTVKSGPPFIKNGSFQHILPVAVHQMQHYVDNPIFNSEEDAAVSFFLKAWKSFNINFIPWAPPHTGTRGAPIQTVLFNAWTTFGATMVDIINPNRQDLRPEERQHANLEIHRRELIEQDADGPWDSSAIILQDMHKLLHRRQPPDDFLLPNFQNSQGTEYIRDTYTQAQTKMKLDKPLHQLIMIIAIVFSCLTPNLFIEHPAKIDESRLTTEKSTRNYLNKLPWISHRGKRPGSRSTVMTMTATFLFALYDDGSRLLDHYYSNGKKFGKAWTDRHSEYH
jgi:hypothetical protein